MIVSSSERRRGTAVPGFLCEIGILDSGAVAVIALDKMTDEQFERHALAVLTRELGPDGLARFLRLHRSGKSDYTRERMEWQRDLTVDEIVESILQHRGA